MAINLMRDPAIRALPWRDLTALRAPRILTELLLTVPWLVLVLACAHAGLWPPALASAFVLFLAGLRSAHDAQHYNLGIPRLATDIFMALLSILMFGSIHAVQVNHLRHHRYCLGEQDFEARSARLPGWKAILFGPGFFVQLHVMGWRHGSRRQRMWIAGEMTAILAWLGYLIAAQPGPALALHAVTMILGQCLTGFFAVWAVHHDLDTNYTIARTQRGWRNTLFLGMFYHLEHHLFPRVPTAHLPRLAERLDRVRPDLSQVRVLP